jgi:hypothetical protein
MQLLFKDEPLDEFPDNAKQEHAYSNCIYNMHYFKIKAGWPVWVFLPEKVHNTNLIKKRKPPELFGGLLNNIFC